jgi:hypothetical protein
VTQLGLKVSSNLLMKRGEEDERERERTGAGAEPVELRVSSAIRSSTAKHDKSASDVKVRGRMERESRQRVKEHVHFGRPEGQNKDTLKRTDRLRTDRIDWPIGKW